MTLPRPVATVLIQPSVSHYREPLIAAILSSTAMEYRLFGKKINPDATQAVDRIRQASEHVADRVTTVDVLRFNLFYWEKGVVAEALTGPSQVLVLEGRIYTLSTWIGAIIGRLRGRSVLFWGHGWKRHERGPKLAFRRLFYALAHGLLLYGDQAREFAAESGIAREKLHVIYNSIYSRRQIGTASVVAERRVAILERLGIEPDAKILLVACRLTARHDMTPLLRAMKEVEASGTRTNAIVIGDGSERVRLQQEAERLGVRVVFLGAVYDPGALAEYYSLADAAISTNASGLNVIQALGFGCPIIAARNDPNAGPEIEAVRDGRTGLLFDCGAVEQLAAAISSLANDRNLRRKLGQAGVDLVLEKYTAERQAAAMERALLSVTQGDSRAR